MGAHHSIESLIPINRCLQAFTQPPIFTCTFSYLPLMSFKRACHVTIGRAWSVPSTPHMIQIVRDCLPLSLPRRRGDAMLGCVRYHYHRLNYLMEVKFHSHFPCRGMRKANREKKSPPPPPTLLLTLLLFRKERSGYEKKIVER